MCDCHPICTLSVPGLFYYPSAFQLKVHAKKKGELEEINNCNRIVTFSLSLLLFVSFITLFLWFNCLQRRFFFRFDFKTRENLRFNKTQKHKKKTAKFYFIITKIYFV